ncbi:aminopeptidase P family protein [Rhodobacteraceae bacterium]|nr:aminopeptidase P family protein [Paracoccaceae bacterium]
MFQDFSVKSHPEHGRARLAMLRETLAQHDLAGFIVPRADIHQGEYVAARDARLSWLTGFTGSAGFCVVLPDMAGVFIDGRYRVQVRHEVDMDVFTPVDWPRNTAGPWIAQHLEEGRLGFDPWLHTHQEIEAIRTALIGTSVRLVAVENQIDCIWTDRPAPPRAPVRLHPEALAGLDRGTKCATLAQSLAADTLNTAVLTQPDSICWLLNIRGSDVERNPLVQSLALVHDHGEVDLFADEAKFDADVRAALGPRVHLRPMDDFAPALRELTGRVLVDPATAPVAVAGELEAGDAQPHWAPDPCVLPKACKTPAEAAGMREAHLRDGAAMAEFLCWLEHTAANGDLSEIDVVSKLESCRQATGALTEISFDTICGAGPNAAIVHYRVTEKSNRPVQSGELLLVDSGGQYQDGTTDITRTVCIGPPPEQVRAPYTRVLKGMIALSQARWPNGLAGRDLDALARNPLWQAGLDYDHGTGHGVGAALCVHEGPARISRISTQPILPGMILSNEPGYYRDGAFGIRIENLVLVVSAPELANSDPDREMLAFETLTYAPIDTRAIERDLLTATEVAWLNDYHSRCLAALAPRVSPQTRAWLEVACAPL